jgi:uncharacterized protein YdeI (YjbR/CyaY-like superfamily)
MGPVDAMFFESAEGLRHWLAANHDRADELWIGFHRKSTGKPGINWSEAVDEALCFGWIDSIRKRIDAGAYANRFTRRRARSTWSAVNIERVAMLIEAGRMTAPGREAFEQRAEGRSRRYSYEQRDQELAGALAERFKANRAAWDFFQTQPPSYRKAATWWVLSATREDTKLRRLATLIEDSANCRRLASVTPRRRIDEIQAG